MRKIYIAALKSLHVSSIVAAPEIVLQSCSKHFRDGLVLLESRLGTISLVGIIWIWLESAHSQVLGCLYPRVRQIITVLGTLTQAGWRRRLSYAVMYAFRDIKSDIGPMVGALET